MASVSILPRLEALLEDCAATDAGITLYHQAKDAPEQLSYRQLHDLAYENAEQLRTKHGVAAGGIVLVHFDNHRDNIIWFWSSIFAGCVPAMSTPLVNNSEGRIDHLNHLYRLLLDPVVLTTRELMAKDFVAGSSLRILAVDDSSTTLSDKPSTPRVDSPMIGSTEPSPPTSRPATPSYFTPATQTKPEVDLTDVAALMLTSGSTGNAKAACLTHEQILTSARGKLVHMPLTKNDTVLNWIGLDHVGSLIELHVTAMVAGCHQVHAPAVDLIADPLTFLRLLSTHKVARTFAPNFFMHRLVQRLDGASDQDIRGISLHNLLYLISGGEPNNVDTCEHLASHLVKLGAPNANTIHPGFGMTETCAGSIYSRDCPKIDSHTEFASLGTCVPGIQMRVTPREPGATEGSLEVAGPIVFKRYFNNQKATSDAFTADGWFITGDTAAVDDTGVLRLVGRQKELININGVKFLPHELETAIDREMIPGVAPSCVLCFAHRKENDQTESIFVVYQHEYAVEDTEARMNALQGISRTLLLFTGARPHVLPLAPGCLERTSLGKLSRAKVRNSLADGKFALQQQIDSAMLEKFRATRQAEPVNATEEKLVQVFHDLGLGSPGMGTEMTTLDTGVSSVELIRLKRAVEKAFSIPDVPIITMMTNTSIRSLAVAIEEIKASEHKTEYCPYVTLQPKGSETPLWLLHPGIGEMLVFLNLVQYFPDRPMYAFRARGLNRGEDPFTSLEEVIETYYTAIKAKQPQGPYALAGYSYGSMLAFEIAKRLEADQPGSVRFLASFNLPPHIKTRMQQLDWTAGMVHIAHFCSIITEKRSEELAVELRSLPHSEQVALLLAESDPHRCIELGLDADSLENWTNVSFSLQKMGWNYEPSGCVPHLDIFFCQPLKVVASTRAEYRTHHLNHWVHFVRDDLRFHEVDGQHYTMIGAELVPKFQVHLKRALAARGV